MIAHTTCATAPKSTRGLPTTTASTGFRSSKLKSWHSREGCPCFRTSASMHPSMVPISLMADSYKATHFNQYPPAEKMVAYGEFRSGFDGDTEDTRLVAYGIQYIVENFVAKQWTMDDLDKAAKFFRTHQSPFFTEFPFPEDLFRKFIKENNGYFPIKIEALPEGTCVHAHVPLYQITAEEDYSHLCTYLETLLTMLWYPSTVATLSRRVRDLVEDAFETSSDAGKLSPLVPSRLHDFGFRGCTCTEQSIIGGVAHLLNFTGSDTMSAAYYAQFSLNNGNPVATSVPATEHSVMTSWETEADAIENMIEKFGGGIYSMVMDSYNYERAIFKVIPKFKQAAAEKGGHMVLRPDSGDPATAVLLGLQAGEAAFGTDVNSKGYKVLRKCGVLQGDGMNIYSIKSVLDAVVQAGYSAENCVFGMGGGLLQKLNRDSMSFATKLSHITYKGGRSRDMMKAPKDDLLKTSLPGSLAVQRVNGIPTVFPAETEAVSAEDNLLKVVYDKGPVDKWMWEDFDSVKARVASEWCALPKTSCVISDELMRKIEAVKDEQESASGALV